MSPQDRRLEAPIPTEPLALDIVLTDRCNLRCRMCRCWESRGGDEISPVTWRSFLSDALDFAPVRHLCLGGGEPLLSSGLVPILNHCRDIGLYSVVVTNGTLLASRADELAKAGFGAINVSLDGLAETHDMIRGIPGTWRRAMEGIRRLRDVRPEGGRIGICSMLAAPNLGEVEELVKVALDSGVDYVVFQAIQQVTHYDGPDWFKDSPLWPRRGLEVDRALDRLLDLKAKGLAIINSEAHLEVFRRYFHDPFGPLRLACVAGFRALPADARGDVRLCIKAPPVGNVVSHSPQQLLMGLKARDARRRAVRCPEKCHFPVNCYYDEVSSVRALALEQVVEAESGPLPRTAAPSRKASVGPSLPPAVEIARFPRPPVLLVVPPPSELHAPPLGVASLAGHLRSRNMAVRVMDLNALAHHGAPEAARPTFAMEHHRLWQTEGSFREILDQWLGPLLHLAAQEVAREAPLMLGLSVTPPAQRAAVELARLVRGLCPTLPVVVGGPGTIDPEIRRLFLTTPGARPDAFVLGEGEDVLLTMAMALEEGRPLKDLAGLVLPDQADQPDIRPPRPQSALDDLGLPAFDLFDAALYPADYFPMEWSRGCSGSCVFCQVPRLWPGHRVKSPHRIVEELRLLRSRGVTFVSLVDSALNLDVPWLEEVCRDLAKAGLGVGWSGAIAGHGGFSPDTFTLMAQAGCTRVEFGVESGSDRVLHRMGKAVDIGHLGRMIGQTHQAGLETVICLIVGFPGETMEDLQATWAFLEEHKHLITRVRSVNALCLQQGTAMMRRPRAFGLTVPEPVEGWGHLWAGPDGNTPSTRRRWVLETLMTLKKLDIPCDITDLGELGRWGDGVAHGDLNNPLDLLVARYATRPALCPPLDGASAVEAVTAQGLRSRLVDLAAPGPGRDVLGRAEAVERLLDLPAKTVVLFAEAGWEAEEAKALAMELRRRARALGRPTKVVLAGPCSFVKALRPSLASGLDGVIVGDPEPICLDLARGMERVAGLCASEGTFLPRPPLRDLASLPFPTYQGLDPARYSSRVVEIRASRGCRRRCAQCDRQPAEGPYRQRPVASVVEEMVHHFDQWGVKIFRFVDPVFNNDPHWVRAFCKALQERRLEVEWSASASVRPGLEDSLLEAMAMAGCRSLAFDLETASDRVLMAMHRGFTAAQAEACLRAASGAGMEVAVSLTVGCPGEAPETVMETGAFLSRLRDIITRVDPLRACQVLPGSLLEKNPRDYGIFLPLRDHRVEWHDGGFNNRSYRAKEASRLVGLLESLNLPHTVDPELKREIFSPGERRELGQDLMERAQAGQGGPDPDVKRNLDLLGVINGQRAFKGPDVLEIELTNRCNLHCAGCWCHSYLLGPDRFQGEKLKRQITRERALDLIDEAADLGVRKIQLSGGGEPLMHPAIGEIIQRVKDRGMVLNLITNFALADGDMVERLVTAGVNELTVSVWAGDEATYRATHPRSKEGTFEGLRQNLRLLHDMKAARDAALPQVKLYNVISHLNARSITAMVSFAIEVGANLIELTPLDIVPQRTESIGLTAEDRQAIIEQLDNLVHHPDFMEIDPTGQGGARLGGGSETVEFARFIKRRSMPPGFQFFMEDITCWRALCPEGYWHVRVEEDHERLNVIRFFYDCHRCNGCPRRRQCPIDHRTYSVKVEYLSFRGLGSFYRRIQRAGGRQQDYDLSAVASTPCTVGWTYGRVQAGGQVIPCCKADKVPMGSITDAPLGEVWNGPVWNDFRHKALVLDKSDPYFETIACYRGCDNLGMNIETHQRLQEVRPELLRLLRYLAKPE